MGFNSNRGYVGHSMSVRAAMAYGDGEMPKSKWTKSVLIDRIRQADSFWPVDLLFSCLLATLRERFLRRSSWHHTGRYFNETDFFALNEDVIAAHDVDGLLEADIAMRARNKKPGDSPVSSAVKGRIRFESWEGSRKHGRFVTHELACLIIGNWAYTECGKKRLDGAHVLDVERFERAPRGTAATYERIAATLPRQRS